MSPYCTGPTSNHDNEDDFTPNYKVDDGYDSKPFNESGLDQESPIHEQILDFTPLEKV